MRVRSNHISGAPMLKVLRVSRTMSALPLILVLAPGVAA
jgi:hypothetical protein